MNWLQIDLLILTVIIGYIILDRIICRKWLYNCGVMAVIFIGGFLIMFLSLVLPTIKESNPNEIRYTYELISLQNSNGIDGSISGGGSFLAHSFSGSIQNTTSCSFVGRYKNGNIKIITDNCDNIIFREGTEYKAEQSVGVFHYKFALNKSQQYWDNYNYVWYITIPKESINSYIKFN
jgi:hypothetical protein